MIEALKKFRLGC